eukprot:1648093-Ditylum_brightwellii.AAC.1
MVCVRMPSTLWLRKEFYELPSSACKILGVNSRYSLQNIVSKLFNGNSVTNVDDTHALFTIGDLYTAGHPT